MYISIYFTKVNYTKYNYVDSLVFLLDLNLFKDNTVIRVSRTNNIHTFTTFFFIPYPSLIYIKKNYLSLQKFNVKKNNSKHWLACKENIIGAVNISIDNIISKFYYHNYQFLKFIYI